jgi:hypothetical protein
MRCLRTHYGSCLQRFMGVQNGQIWMASDLIDIKPDVAHNEGGYLRAGANWAFVTECHPGFWPNFARIADSGRVFRLTVVFVAGRCPASWSALRRLARPQVVTLVPCEGCTESRTVVA